MNRWIFFIFIIIGIIGMLIYKNYLIILIRIEIIIFSIYLLILFLSEKLGIGLDILLIYMSIIIVEAVFGLCIIINFSNSSGSDKFIYI